MNKKPEEYLIVALDVPELNIAREIVDELGGMVDFYKIGLQLFTECGLDSIRFLKEKHKKIMLDLKLHDIPNTVNGALNSISNMEIEMVTIHTMGGFEMMESAQKAVWKRGSKQPLILGVTILTSLDEAFLKDILGIEKSIKEQIIDLCVIAKSAGLGGVVASPAEVSLIKKKCGKDFLVVTPGIRPAGSSHDDQKRVSTPMRAIENGSDFLVIGRSITRVENKRKAAEEILKEIEDGLHKVT